MILDAPKISLYGLRNPADAKTDKDYMRISFVEEDMQFLEDDKRKRLTEK